jgi:hypothetical protein
MSENATVTTIFKPATARQRQLIADLSTELDREITVPASAKSASALIAKTIKERNEAVEAAGAKLAPTARQLRLLEALSGLIDDRTTAAAELIDVCDAAGHPDVRRRLDAWLARTRI